MGSQVRTAELSQLTSRLDQNRQVLSPRTGPTLFWLAGRILQPLPADHRAYSESLALLAKSTSRTYRLEAGVDSALADEHTHEERVYIIAHHVWRQCGKSEGAPLQHGLSLNGL